MSSHCLFSHTAQQHLIKGESNLSSSTGEDHFAAISTGSPARSAILTGDSGLTCKQCEQTGKYPAE